MKIIIPTLQDYKDIKTEKDFNILCARCNKVWFKSGAKGSAKIHGNKEVCEDCKKQHYHKCDKCKTYVHPSEAYTIGKKCICSRCKSEHYFACNGCRTMCPKTQRNNEVYERNLGSFCNKCAKVFLANEKRPVLYRGAGVDIRIKSKDKVLPGKSPRERYSPVFKFIESTTFKNNPEKRFVGVEIETELPGDILEGLRRFKPIPNHLKYFLGWKYDGSLKYGREFITFPTNGDKLFSYIKSLCKYLQTERYECSARCGLHVHFDARDLSEKDIEKIFWVYRLFESPIYSIMPPTRKNNQYCGRLHYNIESRSKFKTFNHFWAKVKSMEADKRFTADSRYKFFNLMPYYTAGGRGNKKTIELRIHEGTINETEIINWIRINLKLINWALKSDWKRILSISNGNENFDHILQDSDLIEYVQQRRVKYQGQSSGRTIINLKERINEHSKKNRTNYFKAISNIKVLPKPKKIDEWSQMGQYFYSLTSNQTEIYLSSAGSRKNALERGLYRFVNWLKDFYMSSSNYNPYSKILCSFREWLDTQTSLLKYDYLNKNLPFSKRRVRYLEWQKLVLDSEYAKTKYVLLKEQAKELIGKKLNSDQILSYNILDTLDYILTYNEAISGKNYEDVFEAITNLYLTFSEKARKIYQLMKEREKRTGIKETMFSLATSSIRSTYGGAFVSRLSDLGVGSYAPTWIDEDDDVDDDDDDDDDYEDDDDD